MDVKIRIRNIDVEFSPDRFNTNQKYIISYDIQYLDSNGNTVAILSGRYDCPSLSLTENDSIFDVSKNKLFDLLNDNTLTLL